MGGSNRRKEGVFEALKNGYKQGSDRAITSSIRFRSRIYNEIKSGLTREEIFRQHSDLDISEVYMQCLSSYIVDCFKQGMSPEEMAKKSNIPVEVNALHALYKVYRAGRQKGAAR